MCSRQCVRERGRLVRVGRQDAKKLGARAVSYQLLQRRLDIDPRGYRKLASRRGDLSRRHAEMSQQRLAQARPTAKTSAADRKGKSHSAFMIEPLPPSDLRSIQVG